MTAPTTYEIGTTLGGMLALSALSTPILDPSADFIEYPEPVILGNGTIRGVGLPQANWHYGFITETQYDKFRVFCTGASTEIFIATIKNDGSYLRYTAVMIMPETYVIRATRYIDVLIRFTNLVAAE